MRMLLVVLPQQVLAVIVAVRRADHGMDVIANRQLRVLGQMAGVGRPLVVELDQDHRTVDAIIEHAVILIAADPRNRFSNGKNRGEQIRQMARYILREQRSHGGWELFYGDGGEISTTIEAYFALKLAGYSADDPAMRRARDFILERGGLTRARVFMKLHLALFGAYPWEGVPTLPPWFMFLPRWFPLNIYTMASWARSSTVPLLVVIDKKPVYDLGLYADELLVEGSRDRADVGWARRGVSVRTCNRLACGPWIRVERQQGKRG